MIPLWFVASRKVEKNLKTKQIPWLAFGVAFSFVIMMFNFPAPGGTTGHAVGAAILALTLGPWFGFLGVTGALLIQCLLFGDGGITTFAANSFNMGLVMSFVSYYVYKLLATRAPLLSRRRWLAAAASGYIGLNVAALCCAIELGLQPILYHTANGSPLYAPFPLSVSIPAMLISHGFVFGFVDAAATGFLVSYIMRSDSSILATSIAQSIPDLSYRWGSWTYSYDYRAVSSATTLNFQKTVDTPCRSRSTSPIGFAGSRIGVCRVECIRPRNSIRDDSSCRAQELGGSVQCSFQRLQRARGNNLHPTQLGVYPRSCHRTVRTRFLSFRILPS